MRFRGCMWMLAAIFGIALCSERACADGKVFASHAAPAEIPDQSALICFDGKTETLAIETRFIAKGKDFAWVVPLPAKPEIRAGTPGMFPTLRAMFLPRVWEFEGAGAAISLLGLLGAGLILVLLGLDEAARRVVGYGLILLFFGSCLLLPSLGLSRGGLGGGSRVAVLERAVIGDFDVSVVQSADASEMKTWLSTNGFQSSPPADIAIENYVRKGWVFVVSKLVRSFDDGRVSAPTPLIFRFPVNTPVYPMQLTGAGATTPLKLELFVFGDSFAFAEGCKGVRRTDVVVPSEPAGPYSLRGSTSVYVSHALLKEVIGGAKQATLLRRTLAPVEMDRDIEIRFASGSATGNQVASSLAAGQLAVVSGMLGFLIAGSILAMRAKWIGPWPAGFKAVGIAAIVGGAGVLIAGSSLPQAPVGDSLPIEMRRRAAITDACYEALYPREKKGLWADLSAEEIANEALRILQTDPEAPRDIRAEDSPGNFVIRSTKDGFECVFYRWDGQEVIELLQRSN